MGLCGIVVALLVTGTVPPAGAATGTRYQVQRGDSLGSIAARLGVTAAALARANALADPNLVYAGTWLRVPGSGSGGGGSGSGSGGSGTSTSARTHVVAVGETLSSIAARYGLATATLARANGIADPNLVYVGARLAVPVPVAGTAGGSGSATGSGSSSSGTGLPLRLQQSPARLALMPAFDRWAAAYGVPPDLLKSVTWLESGWQRTVVSSTGAVGIGQLMPSTVVTINRILGTDLSPWNAEENIRMSARYLALLLSATGWNTTRTLAGYYQGLASVQRNGLYPSTLAYIDGVLVLRHRF